MNGLVHRSANTAPGLLLSSLAARDGGGGCGGGFTEPAGTASSKSDTTTSITLQTAESDMHAAPAGCGVPVGRVGRVRFASEQDKRGESASDSGRLHAWPVAVWRTKRK